MLAVYIITVQRGTDRASTMALTVLVSNKRQDEDVRVVEDRCVFSLANGEA